MVLVISNILVQRAENGLHGISRLEGETVLLFHLTQNYTQNPTTDSQSAWQSEYETIQKILNGSAFDSYQDQQSFQELKKINNTSKSLFDEIGLTSNDQHVRERLQSEILIHAKNFVQESTILGQFIFNESEQVRSRGAMVSFVLIGFLLIVAVGIWIIISRTVSGPINKLTSAIKRIEDGDLSAKVPGHTNDEIGLLGSTFNSMMSKLFGQTRALKEAKARDDMLLANLNMRIKELEDIRKAMSNVLQDLEVERLEIAQSKAKDEALLDNIGDGMIAVDKDKKIIMVNKTAEQLLGIERETAMGKVFDEVLQNENAAGVAIPPEECPIAFVLRTGQKFTSPFNPTYTSSALISGVQKQIFQPTTQFYVRKNGTRFPVALTISPIMVNGEVVGAIDIFRDTTKEQEIEKLRIDFLALASHQLRTPLSGTKWLIETIRRGVTGEMNPKQKEYLEQIYGANERMIALVVDMLDVLKFESSAVVMKKEKIHLTDFYDKCIQSVGKEAKMQKITIRSALSRDAQFMVETDSEMLQLMMQQLILNGIRYSQSGQEVVVDAEEKSDDIVLSVKDSGIGIPKIEQDRIFERFYRASNAKEHIPGGSGLGLYRISLIAQKIGAKVSFISDEGKGSTFYVSLPKGGA